MERIRVSYKDYNKENDEGIALQRKSRLEGNVLENMQYFDRWIRGKENAFGNNGPTTYNEVFFQASDFCITFCFNFPKDSGKSNLSFVIDATEGCGEFENKLHRAFTGLMNLRNEWVEWERKRNVDKK